MLYNPTSLQDLENNAEYIVKGVFLDDSVTDLKIMDNGTIYYGVTLTSFKTSEIYQGDIKLGDEITVAEPYYIIDNDIFHFGNYFPSDVGREYIMFLGKNHGSDSSYDGTYFPDIYERGRYPVIEGRIDIDALTNAQLNLAKGDSEIYRSIYAEVIGKYMS